MITTDSNLRPADAYFKNLAEGRLTYLRCSECGAAVFYPRVACPTCGGVNMNWQESAGVGTVYSMSKIPRRDKEPIFVCLIELDEGFRMMSTLVGSDADEINIGQRVRAQFDQQGDAPRVVFGSGALSV